MEHIKTGMIFPEKNEYNILQALTITVSASFFAFFQKHLTLYTLPHVISGKMIFQENLFKRTQVEWRAG